MTDDKSERNVKGWIITCTYMEPEKHMATSLQLMMAESVRNEFAGATL